jgi:hypothetical protein
MKHKCARPGCREQVPNGMLACRNDWMALPLEVRQQVRDGWSFRKATGEAADHRLAVLKAIEFWRVA